MQRAAQFLRNVLGQRRLAGTRESIKAQGSVPPRRQRLHDSRQFKATFDIQVVKVISAECLRAAWRSGRPPQSVVGILQLAVDECFEAGNIALLRVGSAQARETGCCSDLGRRQPLAAGEPRDKSVTDRRPLQGFANHALPGTGGWGLQLQMVGKAP